MFSDYHKRLNRRLGFKLAIKLVEYAVEASTDKDGMSFWNDIWLEAQLKLAQIKMVCPFGMIYDWKLSRVFEVIINNF